MCIAPLVIATVTWLSQLFSSPAVGTFKKNGYCRSGLSSNGKLVANPASLPPKARGQPTKLQSPPKISISPFTVKGASTKPPRAYSNCDLIGIPTFRGERLFWSWTGTPLSTSMNVSYQVHLMGCLIALINT
ncbi:hypothetical protein NA56DRAFT_708638 [Hyaloscypha hepaticicola]|uniref:Uncharacterized protein n=1 Tax=Hyaloscypha hepaticicola TaxID=2082293 RepID=A0A2J6PRS7_9HELO|nr:hypothetical protein NA56DRAFT_708638 [Hyaloscypha hepaticicola]